MVLGDQPMAFDSGIQLYCNPHPKESMLEILEKHATMHIT